MLRRFLPPDYQIVPWSCPDCKASICFSAIVVYDGWVSSIDPKSLRLFARVAELGTIAAAANRECIASAAVSKRLKELEVQLGATLLLRTNRGIEPTVAGRVLVDLSHRVLNDLDSLRQVMREVARGSTGHVRLFANISAITQFLPMALSTFMARHPHVHVHLEERVSGAIVEAVASNAADVGVLIDRGPQEGIECKPFRHDRLAVLVPYQHPLAKRKSVRFAELVDQPFVGLHVNSQLNLQLTRAANELNRAWSCRVNVTSYDALIHMVEAGLGIGVLPSSIGRAYAKALRIRLIALEEAWADRSLVLATRSFDALAPAPRLLVEHLLADVSDKADPEADKAIGRGRQQGRRQPL